MSVTQFWSNLFRLQKITFPVIFLVSTLTLLETKLAFKVCGLANNQSCSHVTFKKVFIDISYFSMLYQSLENLLTTSE